MSRLFFSHPAGQRMTPLQERALREAYLTLYAFAGANKEDHFIFTSSAAEAVNHVVFAAYLDVTRKTGKNHFLCSSLDEAPTILSMSRLHDLGCIFQMIPAGHEGRISAKGLSGMLTPRTALLSLSWANGLTGVVQPLFEISQVCKERGILLHVDASHALGKGDFSFMESGADILTFSGPEGGMGGLFIHSELEISPLILGGEEQGNRRGGPFKLSNLLDFAQWAKEEHSHTDHYTIEIARLRALFESSLLERLPGAYVLFQDQERVPHLSTLVFPGVNSDALLFLLNQKGVAATAGGNQFQHLSHLLKACLIEPQDCFSALNFVFSHKTTPEEIELGVAIILESVESLRRYSQHLLLKEIS